MIEMHPDELFSKFYENASARKKKTLELIHNACKKQSESDIKDFYVKHPNVYSEKRAIYEELTMALKPLPLDDLGKCEVCAKIQDQ